MYYSGNEWLWLSNKNTALIAWEKSQFEVTQRSESYQRDTIICGDNKHVNRCGSARYRAFASGYKHC